MDIKIFLSDDHKVFRNGLKVFLEQEKGFEIIGEAGDGTETLKKVLKLKPDILLLDISMPGPPGVKIVEELNKKLKEIKIIILTMHEDDYYLKEFIKAGAKGFILKKSSGNELINAIKIVNEDKFYIDPNLSEYMVLPLIDKPKIKIKDKINITRRESEILNLVALGFTNQEIGEKLYISKRTVETHRRNIMEKLGLKSRAELVRYAIDNKTISV